MKKILTAIGNPTLNKKIKQTNKYEVVTADISNDEELLEWLERGEKIDILFLYSNVITHYKFDEMIKIIRKIQENVTIFFFKNEDTEITFKEDDKLKIYTNIEFDLKKLEEITPQEGKKERESSKIISITGANGVGKSTFSTCLAKNVEKLKTKTLLIDFDLEENQIRTILKIKKKFQQSSRVEDNIININKNLDVLCYLDFLFTKENEIKFFEIQEMFKRLRNKYDFIIIDTSSRIDNEYTKKIFYNSDNIIFLLEPNILGVKKSKNMLEVFENDWKISSEKIKIILNKSNIYQISDKIIKELFSDISVLGKIKYSDSYNLMINKSIDKKEIKKEYEKIYKNICHT